MTHPDSRTRVRPRRPFTRFLIALSLALAGTGVNAEAPFEPAHDEDGIVIETRPVATSGHREFRAMMTLTEPLARVLAVLDDIEACPSWVHQCREARVVSQISPTERLIYQVSELPFPARSRDLVFRVQLESASNAVSITLQAEPSALPEVKNLVRVSHSYGRYTLTEVDAGTTHIVWTLFVDPAGNLPSFMVNRMLTSLPLLSLRQLRLWIREPRYDGFGLLRDEQGRPVGLLQSD